MRTVHGWQRALYLALAGIFLVLAAVGILLPILPGTPFLLLSSWFLLRASPAWNERLYRTRLFGPMLREWDEHHGVRLSVKLTAIATVLIGTCTSLVFGNLATFAACWLIAFAAIGVGVVVWLPLIRD